ncbi:MAG TPA: glycosyltransferase family 39 protein [Usitatibacter sp.]|nr:glycosyltransferase family 39 protein [Usitatibacter sp.]
MTDAALRGRIAYDGPPTRLKTALFLIVCLAWLVPGLVGHDPWKADEAVSFGNVLEILRTGDWIVFRVAGEPNLEKAPLFLWTAALMAKAFGGLLALHDAARLASGVFMAATLALLAGAAYELLGGRAVRQAVLLFIGCLGLLIRAHEMTPDLAGLAGVALALYGLALSLRRPLVGGAATGAGVGVAFLGNGFLPLGMLSALLMLLPLGGGAEWRNRRYALTAGMAVLCALPLLAAWPAALALRSHDLLRMWLDNAGTVRWSNPFAAGDGPGVLYFAKLLPWYTWPAWPLAAWTVWRAWKRIEVRTDLQLPLLAFVAFFVVAAFFADARDANALPLLLPLAILGVADIETLPRGAASALDWFGMTTFFLFAALLWIGWFAALTGRPELAAAMLQREVPGFTYRFSFIAFAFAALLTLVWIAVAARSLRSTRRALVNWTSGITMVWMLVMTLGVPIVDQARSYRGVGMKMVAAMPAGTRCIARRNVGDAQRALLDYFVDIQTVRDDSPLASACGVLLVQASPARPPDAGPEWKELWRGARPGDRTELFVLYQRQ